MYTADTITDEQIRALLPTLRDKDYALALEALSWGLRFGRKQRARCAEILNARSTEVRSMWSGDTITDKKIHEMLSESEGIEHNDVDVARICLRALGHGSHVLSRCEARETLAKILNAREEQP